MLIVLIIINIIIVLNTSMDAAISDKDWLFYFGIITSPILVYSNFWYNFIQNENSKNSSVFFNKFNPEIYREKIAVFSAGVRVIFSILISLI